VRSIERETADGAPTVDVLIAGGGPFGLMLANELGRRGVRAALVDAKPSTPVNPQANATQARTMEHYRRLGFADEVRSMGLPEDFSTDIAYFTRFATHDLARFRLLSAREARERVATLSGSSRTRSTSAGSSPPPSRASPVRGCSRPTSSSAGRRPSATPAMRAASPNPWAASCPRTGSRTSDRAAIDCDATPASTWRGTAGPSSTSPASRSARATAASPVIVYDGSQAPPDAANRYDPSASPGGRAPHLWLDAGVSLFDSFGFEWTLLRLGPAPPGGERFVDAARRRGIELEVVDVPSREPRDLYEAPLALVRPDQVVAWRGFDDAQADAVAAVAVGHSADGTPAARR
jgi:hypothetical protein